MKKAARYAGMLSLCFALLFLLQGCLKDSYRDTYRIFVPIFKTLSDVRSEMKSGPAQPLVNIGKLNVYGPYIFLNEVNKGIHVIDNSNPAAPRNLSFITIPNNVDLAIKGAYLYADSFSDVAVFDISNPANIQPVRFLNNVIRDRNRYWTTTTANPDSIQVIVGFSARDTTVDARQYRGWQACRYCLFPQSDLKNVFYTAIPQAGSGVGVGGSMARFAIVNNYLYAVSNSELYSISLAEPANPQLAATNRIGWNVETMYPFRDQLFIGSRNGMFVYSLQNPASPVQVSRFTHATSCDPVIAEDQYAYVTLRSGTSCNGTLNQLDVLDVSNLAAPNLVASLRMSNPHGLAKDGDKLFICDGEAGLKMYNAASRNNILLEKQIGGIETYDVIAQQGKAIVVATDGLYQFTYGNGAALSQLSKLSITKAN